MKYKLLPLILIFGMLLPLCSGETEDLLFAVGLYEDGDYSLAQQVLEKFTADFPQSEYYNEMRCLLADTYLNNQDYPKSANLYRELSLLPSMNSQLSRILFGLAQAEFYLNNYQETQTILKELIEKYPDHQEISQFHYLLGKAYYQTGDYPSSLENLEFALNKQDTMPTRLKLIQVYLALDDLDSAQCQLNSAIELYPESPDLHFAIILVHSENITQRRFNEVLSIGSELISISSPYYQQHLLLKGIAKFELGDYEKAAQILEKLPQIKARYYYALTLMRLNDPDQATVIFTNLQSADDPEIMANSLFYLADLQPDLEKKENLLADFVTNYPDNAFLPQAYYQYGLTLFKQHKLQLALKALDLAIDKGLDQVYLPKAIFLKAESLYLSNEYQTALDVFDSYTNLYPQGEFSADAHFKKGLCLYNTNQYDSANEQFDLVIYNYPESSVLGLSNFYKGEIELLKKNFEEARKLYSIALNQDTDKDLIWLRIAQSWQKSKNYSKALAAANNVADDSNYYYDKTLLSADLYFAQKNYEKALSHYQTALKQNITPEQKESIQAKIAWTYYQQNDYEKATAIYNQLSIKTDNPAVYTYQAATALFSAQQYQNALQQYQLFLQNFPESPKALDAQIAIADCYYNLKQFDNAKEQYKLLLTQVTDPELYQNILDGWKWATEQSDSDFLQEVDDFLASGIKKNFQFLILGFKAKHLFYLEKYQEVVKTVDYMKSSFIFSMQEIEYLKARSLKKLELYDEAADFYAKLFFIYEDPVLQLEWADITLIKGDIPTTIRKLQFAAQKLKSSQAILKLLTIELDHNDSQFLADYQKFSSYLRGIDLEKAQLLKIRWLITGKQFAEAQDLINSIKNSSNQSIKAEAQYLSGYKLYSEDKFNLAVPELLRVRHLFPHFQDIRNEAETLAFRAYLKQNKIEEARNLLSNISQDIDQQTLKELQILLEGE